MARVEELIKYRMIVQYTTQNTSANIMTRLEETLNKLGNLVEKVIRDLVYS